MSRAISNHEWRHCLALAVGAKLLDVDVSRVVVSIVVTSTEGQVTVEYGDPVGNMDDRAISERLASLGAAGPIAALPGPDAIGLLRAGAWDELGRRAGLSEADLALLARLGDGAAVQVAKVVLGVLELEDHLRLSGTEKAAKALRDLSNAGVGDDIPLNELVPAEHVERAVAAAEIQFSTVMG
ncbi:hypothetical protein [uncultured Albimonas sp.]|uniref:hypothetical protein n=1 Tax=uncultured Albimonas sp. TaxID=1331701 RepID=UPI0030ECC068|tara:strand:- start:4988 stop:5536 length:549 start_codon:yes stop_codon:yes gene_type:complete